MKAKINLPPLVFGPLTTFIEDDQITDIDFNGESLWITTVDNKRVQIDFGKEEMTIGFLERFTGKIANEVSKNLNATETVLEAETNTLRITMVHESVALRGRNFCIRKSLPCLRFGLKEAIDQSYCSKEILSFLINCVVLGTNLVICGEPGAGKTECAKFLSQFICPTQKVVTIEDNPEWHFHQINPLGDCIELKVNPWMDYKKAIKTSLRLNPGWLMLSEVRSSEAKVLLECWSTGVKGITTLHTDSVRKIPDRLLHMMDAGVEMARYQHDIFSYVDVGILLRKKECSDKKVRRYIDQICIFTREGEANKMQMIVEGGKIISKELPLEIKGKMQLKGIIDLFFHERVQQIT